MNPVVNEAALHVKKKKLIVVADLHIGIEYELYEKGISIGSRTEGLIERIKKISKELKAKDLLILGDMKHVVPRSTATERRELLRFIDALSDLRISLIPGNHDGNIKKIVGKRIEVLPSQGIVLGSIGFVHGHRWPDKSLMKAKVLVLAHTHPVFSFKDRFGYRFAERCWIISKPNYVELEKRYGEINLEKVVIMPAFNPLCGGISVNEEGFIGVVDKIVDKNDMEIFLLDGTYIGKLDKMHS